MLRLRLPVLGGLGGARRVPDEQHVLGSLLLGGLGKVPAARADGLPSDDQEFVMRNGVRRITLRRDPLIGQDLSPRLLLRAGTLIQDRSHADPAWMGLEQRRGDVRRTRRTRCRSLGVFI